MLIESFHAGRRGQRRYCSLHHPATGLMRSTGIVLCHPLGNEYFRSHRTYIRLADRLAQFGFPVMRFDYAGTGDAEGSECHARLREWVQDAIDAADGLRARESLSRIALAGMRFGATISALAASQIESACLLFLWDPVEDGAQYIEQQLRLHASMLRDLQRFPRSRQDTTAGEDTVELVGARYAATLLDDIRAIQQDDAATPSIRDIIVAQHAPRARRAAASVHEIELHKDYGWKDARRIEESIVDGKTLHRAVAMINEVAA